MKKPEAAKPVLLFCVYEDCPFCMVGKWNGESWENDDNGNSIPYHTDIIGWSELPKTPENT